MTACQNRKPPRSKSTSNNAQSVDRSRSTISGTSITRSCFDGSMRSWASRSPPSLARCGLRTSSRRLPSSPYPQPFAKGPTSWSSGCRRASSSSCCSPIIIVGQNIQAKAADERADATYRDADAILKEALKIQEHLEVQDTKLLHLIEKMAKLEAALEAGRPS